MFYEGHIPAFTVNSFLKKGLGHPGINPEFEVLFARGIDPGDQAAADARAIGRWPSRDEVQDYGRRVDAAVLDALESATVEGDANPVLRRGQGLYTMMEHEVLHQETLLYMWHRFDGARKTRPERSTAPDAPAPVAPAAFDGEFAMTRKSRRDGRPSAPNGKPSGFGWDNRVTASTFSSMSRPRRIDAHNVTKPRN